jgi:hypothetical protein
LAVDDRLFQKRPKMVHMYGAHGPHTVHPGICNSINYVSSI